MSENTEEDLILNLKKDYYKNNKDRLREEGEVITKAYLKKKKPKENTERIGIIICPKKRNRS